MTDQKRTIRVEALSRVEGEGGLTIHLRDGTVDAVELRIYEPPRFFEAFLRGRAPEEVPDIVARICGICPVAYQMSAVQALERACGVEITPEIRLLRKLLYCGEWIESHSLHMHLLHAPDFLKCESGLKAAETHPDEIRRGLRLKKYGNELLEVLGGRAIHPVNVALGGFYRAPRSEELARLVPCFEWGLQAAIETVRWVAGFSFPDFETDYDFVALTHPDEYAMNEGTIESSRGGSWSADTFETAFEERQVPHSTALQCVRRSTNESYLVGPLARFNLSFDRLSEAARRTAGEIGFAPPCRNPFRSIIARGLEVVHAYEVALTILRSYREPSGCRVEVRPGLGEGCGATEAPRGLLYHRYRIDAAGLVAEAKIVPPTSQNQGGIERDLTAWLPRVLHEPDDEIAHSCERVIRSYDPCISCATHFLRVDWDRR
ncbi:MAG: Ni/Fe hydrogenase subunit alpha [Planctomycetia bacterium]|nr:Ni/Fe hydrogenase subunit alpha [Planctomycetia bacterium]